MEAPLDDFDLFWEENTSFLPMLIGFQHARK